MNRRQLVLAIGAASVARLSYARGVYTYERVDALSSGQSKVTIHLPTNAPYTVNFVGATLKSTTAGQFELLRDGTAPTATAVIPAELNGGSAGVARAYYASNVGSGTHVKYYDLQAGIEQPIDMGQMGLTPGRNITFQSPSSFTSTEVRIFVQWTES